MITLLTLVLLMCSACTSSLSYTFQVNGDILNVKLNTTDGWKLEKTEEGFNVKNPDGDIAFKAMFIKPEYVSYYQEVAMNYDYDMFSTDDIVYTYYQYEDDTHTENNVIISIGNTGILGGNITSYEELQKAVSRLSFELQ